MRLQSLSPIVLAVALAAPAAATVPLDAFVQQASFYNPNMAPDGKHIAVSTRVPADDRFVSMVTIYTLPDLKVTTTIRMPMYEAPLDYTWVSNQRLVIRKGREFGSREQPTATGEVLATDIDGGRQEYLYGYRNLKSSHRGERYGDDRGNGDIDGTPHVKNDHFFLGSHLWKGNSTQLVDIDAVSATRKLLADIPARNLGFVFQQDDTPRFAHGIADNGEPVLYRRNDSTGSWDAVSANLGRRYVPLRFLPGDAEFLAFYSPNGEAPMLIRENAATGKRTTLYDDANNPPNALLYAELNAPPFAVRSSLGKPRTIYFDPNSEAAKLHALLSAQFPGDVVTFIDFTDNGDFLLFSVTGDRDPGTYYLFNKKAGKADLLFTAMPAIDPAEMAPRLPISFKARDGVQLFGFLTMPKHAAGAKLPLVLLPHGGPHGRYDTWYFNDDAQFLASRGYAVLQVNFRGSGGRGVNFEEAGYRQWGAKIQDDLVDGVKWAIAQGEIDDKRMCVYGVSFGAYSALMLAAREPALFKCAVGYAGIYDLNLMYEDRAKREKSLFSIFNKYIGQDAEELKRFSPALQAEKITVPVLLVHGEADKRVPIVHAETMRAALIKANRPPEWMAVPNEGHGFYNTKNIKAFYQKLEAFLAKHLAQ